MCSLPYVLGVVNGIVRAECQFDTGYMVDLKDRIKIIYLKSGGMFY